MQDQLLQVDHQEEDNKGRTKIDISCHLSSLISTQLLYSREFFASIGHRNLIFFFTRKSSIGPLLSFALKLLREKRVSDRSRLKSISPGCVSDKRSACIEAFGSPALWFCHLYLCTSPSQVGASLSTLRLHPPSFVSAPLRSKMRFPSFSLSLFFFLSLYLDRYKHVHDTFTAFYVC